MVEENKETINQEEVNRAKNALSMIDKMLSLQKEFGLNNVEFLSTIYQMQMIYMINMGIDTAKKEIKPFVIAMNVINERLSKQEAETKSLKDKLGMK